MQSPPYSSARALPKRCRRATGNPWQPRLAVAATVLFLALPCLARAQMLTIDYADAGATTDLGSGAVASFGGTLDTTAYTQGFDDLLATLGIGGIVFELLHGSPIDAQPERSLSSGSGGITPAGGSPANTPNGPPTGGGTDPPFGGPVDPPAGNGPGSGGPVGTGDPPGPNGPGVLQVPEPGPVAAVLGMAAFAALAAGRPLRRADQHGGAGHRC